VHEAYTYLSLSGGPATARDAGDALRAAGAVVVGAWSGAGGIGWWDDEVTVLASWPDGRGVVDVAAGTAVPLVASARPTAIAPLDAGGVFAHRWFHIASESWGEFLDLSTGAWPAFESAYGATIEGFLRAEDSPAGTDRVLLITRYPSLASWETSRGVLRDPSGDVQEAGRRFLRRRELTQRSIVRTGTLVTI
jgi:hypothetical protein